MTENEKKVVLITGASAGIGKSTAKKLLEEGYIVYGTARRVEQMKDLEELGAHIFLLDVTDDESIVQGVERIIKEQGRIDVLINNAGYGSYGAIEDVPLEEAKRQFEVNVFGLARLCQVTLPHMRNNKYGKIVNISSIGGKIYTPLGGWYHATKFAVEGLSDCLRCETKPFNIDVIVIEPGIIATEFDDIAINNLLKTSGGTAYKDLANRYVNAWKNFLKGSSSPDLIAETIAKALKAKRPKTRYVAGKMARPFLLARALLPDKLFDRLLESMT